MEVEIFPPHTSFCFGLPARTAPSRFAVNGEEPLLRKKKKPSINHFLGNGSLIQQDGLSDDLQLLVINANSDLWPAVLHQNSSSTASSPPIEATVSVLISCDARAVALFQPLLLFTFFFFFSLQVFICRRTFHISIPDLWLSGLSQSLLVRQQQMNSVLSHYNEATDSL